MLNQKENPALKASSPWVEYWIPALAGIGLLLHLLGSLTSDPLFNTYPLLAVIILGGLPLLWRTGRELGRGRFNVDLIAIVSIYAGLLVGQYLAAAIIVLMMSGGGALEAFAVRRASNSLQSLLQRRPRLANIQDAEGEVKEVSVEEIKIGDILLIKPGEAVPVDGDILSGSSEFDEALLTGESLPVLHGVGENLLSGTLNLNSPVSMRATLVAEKSTYARIVELVRQAQDRKSSIQRLADRFGLWFTPITFLMVALTWIFTRDATVAYAVLVIATPCPLILATPVAIIAGIGRAAHLGIIIKSGAALEGVARAKMVLFDKTGTITQGDLSLEGIHLFTRSVNENEALTLAASLAQYSNHVVARALSREAKLRGLELKEVSRVKETAGGGTEGCAGRRFLRLGSQEFLRGAGIRLLGAVDLKLGTIRVYLAVDEKAVATFLLGDAVHPESRSVIAALSKKYGVKEIAMLTGDREAVARNIAEEVGLAHIYTDLKPEDKLRLVEEAVGRAHRHKERVIMIGDGINDAPALERADVGIAIGRQGGEIAVEAADIVLLGGKIKKLPDVWRISQAVLRIASQGIWFGMLASFLGMLTAAFGYLPPVTGALTQEVIDIVVIFNALRVLKV